LCFKEANWRTNVGCDLDAEINICPEICAASFYSEFGLAVKDKCVVEMLPAIIDDYRERFLESVVAGYAFDGQDLNDVLSDFSIKNDGAVVIKENLASLDIAQCGGTLDGLDDDLVAEGSGTLDSSMQDNYADNYPVYEPGEMLR